jgi:transglutaminase-like putative cysteine protease
MAHEQEETPGHGRLLALGAVALLVAATAVAFGRVFTGHMPTLKLVGAGLASLAIAAALERRSPVLAAVGSGIGLVLAISYLVFPQTLWHGIPAGRTFHAVGLAIRHVGEQTRVQVAPTPPLRPLLMAAITALWTAAFSSHALALRSGSPLLASVPCAALLAFAGIVMSDGPRRGYAALFLVAVLCVLFVDGLRRVRQWGPVRPWKGFAPGRFAGATTMRGARRVTVAAIAVALLIPGVLPGFRSSPWLDSIGKGGNSPQVDPLVSVTASLKSGKAIPLFTVRARQGVYWRWMGLDQFDGDTWTSDDLDISRGAFLLSGRSLPAPQELNAKPGGQDVETLTQSFHIIAKPGNWLPMAYAPEAIDLPSGGIRFDPDIVAARPSAGVHAGLDYSVTSLVPEPTFGELDRSFNFHQFSRYLQLPPSTRSQILPIVRQVLADAGNPSDPIRQVLAIQNFFTSTGHFVYDTSVTGRHDTTYLLKFLTQTRLGFCQQFSSAMAVMLRAIGVPSRVAVGFAQGTLNTRTGTYTVTTADAHSWVEVLFPGFGWIPFEPTPARSNTITTHIVNGSGTAPGTGGPGARGRTAGPGTQRDDNRPGDNPPPGVLRRRSTGLAGARGGGGLTPSRSYGGLIALILGSLAVLAALGIPLWKMAWRRRELRRARSPREITLAAYRVFASRAADVGYGKRPGETLPEYRARLRLELPSPNGDLDTLTRVVAAAAYSPEAPSRQDASQAIRSGRSAIAAVRRDAPKLRRLVGALRPRIDR